MKKFINILLFVTLGWLIKLSYDFYFVSKQLNDIQQSLHKSEQKNANLNDQLIAVQRQTDEPKKLDDQKPVSPVNAKFMELSPSVLIKQQLELVQFAMQQQQFIYALEHLTQLSRIVDQYELADAVKLSLHQTITQDMQSIQQFVIAKNVQQAQLAEIIKQIDQNLQAELTNNQLKVTQKRSENFWQKWLKIDVIAEQSPVLASRKFVLKEVQFRLLLAQQLFNKGQIIEFQEMLNQAIYQLNQLPDASSQKIKQQLLQLKQKPVLPTPKLSSFSVVG